MNLISLVVVASGMVLIPDGTYVPFFRDGGEGNQEIHSFTVDRLPVTTREFLEFVKANPEWRKSNVKRIFADERYLLSLGGPQTPITQVSWFAARAFCEAKGKRLLTVAEWEYASDAHNPQHLQSILEWYAVPSGTLMNVEKATVNRFGLKGMHGLIWEWVEDFSSVMIPGGSFCGGGALKAKDPNQYATFMRFAFRSSLKADSTVSTLGFRCAK